MELAAVGADRPAWAWHCSDQVENAVEAGERACRAENSVGRVDDPVRVSRPFEAQRHRAWDSVDAAGKRLDVVEVGGSVGVQDQFPVQRRGAAEGAGVGDRRAEIVDDGVASLDPYAVEGDLRRPSVTDEVELDLVSRAAAAQPIDEDGDNDSVVMGGYLWSGNTDGGVISFDFDDVVLDW